MLGQIIANVTRIGAQHVVREVTNQDFFRWMEKAVAEETDEEKRG